MKTNTFISRYCLVMFLASSLSAQDKADPPVASPVKWGNVVPPTIKADPDWCAHLTQLKIPHELVVVPGAGHGTSLKHLPKY